MRTPMKAAVGALAALTLTLSACGGGSGSTDNQSPAANNTQMAQQAAEFNQQPRDNVKDGGTLTTNTDEISSQLNTFQADGTAYTQAYWRWYNPVLMLFSSDGTATPNPDYIADQKTEEKGGKTVVTYTINPKAKYNDGTPIDWKVFEATWKANNGSDPKFIAADTTGYGQVASVTKGADDRQAVVTYKGVYAWTDGLFNNLLHPKAATPDVYNKGYINNAHAEWGAGPYTVDKLDAKNGTLSFKKNPDWWGDPGKLDTRTFKALEPTASINAFKNGQLDAASVASKDRLAQVQSMSDITILKNASSSQSLLTLNAKSESGNLKDINVRKAVMQGVDRETLLKVRYNGLDYTETPPGSFNLYPFQKGYEDNLGKAGYKYDAAAANKLLDDAGWTRPTPDGIREKAGKPLSLIYPVLGDDPNTIATAKALTSMEKAIGVEVKIQQGPATDFSKVFNGGQFDMFALGFSSTDPFGYAYFCQIFCTDSGLNQSGTSTPAMDKELRALAKVGDPQQQITEGNKLEQKILGETWGLLPLFNGPSIIATKKGLANYTDITGNSHVGLFYIGKPQDVGWQK